MQNFRRIFFFKFGFEWTEGWKNVHFQRKTGHISETVRKGPRLLLITNRKCHTPCLELTDLG